ncbi:NAD(P)H-dependent oxidoreductase [Pseudoroseomonas globiformis]|uniref:NAD(P)H-dependent oxidoreductase n=1 Tax=Teichococcus globiformis TaxID=2307229 RepID=A0ABV7G402_9PROT
MTETLILMCHPDYARSRANLALAGAARDVRGVEVVHLDALYPEGRIDAAAEAARLIAARRIVLQFPVQWYSTPRC